RQRERAWPGARGMACMLQTAAADCRCRLPAADCRCRLPASDSTAMAPPGSFEISRWLRVGLLVLPLVMGAALVGSALSDRRRTYEASELLVRGQADWFARSIVQSLLSDDGPPDAEQLAAAYEELEGDGLRYLALL